MSPAPRVILLDSCAYFRLGQSIRPLLQGTFGPPPPFSLFVLAILDQEYLTSSRLRNKFEWVHEPEYVHDRASKRYSCRGKATVEVDTAFSYLAGYASEHKLRLAPEDLKALAVTFVRNFVLISDDRGIQEMASAHGIECWNSLKLLKLMLDNDRITKDKLIQIVEYWDHQNDLPCARHTLRVEFTKLFGFDCPI